jgi:hypothetical protein
MVQGMNTLEKQPRRLLWGAKEIAAAVFGASAKEHWHSIYNLRDELPIFEMGNVLCAWDNEIEAVMAAKTADALARIAKAKEAAEGTRPAEELT